MTSAVEHLATCERVLVRCLCLWRAGEPERAVEAVVRLVAALPVWRAEASAAELEAEVELLELEAEAELAEILAAEGVDRDQL